MKAAASAGSGLLAPLIAGGAPEPDAIGRSIRNFAEHALSFAVLVWDTTTNREYLASTYSRRGLRGLMVPMFFAIVISDYDAPPAFLVYKILDLLSFFAMLLIHIFSRRNSLGYDLAVLTLAVANLTLAAVSCKSLGVCDNDLDRASILGAYSSVAFLMTLCGVHCVVVCAFAFVWMVLYIGAVPSFGAAALAATMFCVMGAASIGADALSGAVFALVRANAKLLENAGNGMCAVDCQGIIRHASEQLCEVFGGEALVGQRLADLVPMHQQREVQVLPLQGEGRPCAAYVQCCVRTSQKVFDCKMICFLRSRNMSLLTLLVVGELRDDVEDHQQGGAEGSQPRVGAGGASAGGASCPVRHASDSSEGEGEGFAVDWTKAAETDLRSVASLALTTSTGGLFPNLVSLSAVTPEVSKLEQLGLSEHWIIPQKDLCVFDGPAFRAGPLPWPDDRQSAPCHTARGSWSGTPVFVKYAEDTRRDTDTGMHLLLNELRMLRQVRHPNIVSFLGACFDYGSLSIALVLEHVEGPSLDRFIHAGGAAEDRGAIAPRGPLDRHTQVQLMIQVAQALQHLHARAPPIIHGNLAPSNILIDRRPWGPRPKLFGFGLAQFATTSQTRVVGGDWRCQAPETFYDEPEPPTPGHDMYAFGCLVFFAATGRAPFSSAQGSDFGAVLRAVESCDPGWNDHHPSADVFMRSLSQRCMRKEPGRRLTAPEAQVVLTMHPDYREGPEGGAFARTKSARGRHWPRMQYP